MRRIARKLALAACAIAPSLAAFGNAAAAAPALAKIAPFRPESVLNERPALCDPFLAGWIAAFDGGDPLGEDGVDLAAIYPQAQHSEMPGLAHASHDQLPSYNMSADLDGDGEDEVLWFRADHLGWRYRGVSLYVFDSRADFERKDDPDLQPHREIHRYQPINRARVLKIDGRYYTLDGPTAPAYRSLAGLAVSLLELHPSETARPVCTVALFPAASAYADVLATSPLFQATRDVYAGPSRCGGSSGWTPPSFDFALPTILYRPWVLKPAGPEDMDKRRQADIAREIAYLNWGVKDPQSWRDYLEVKAGRKPFVSDIAAYYRAAGLATSKAEARNLAERAWRFVLDTLLYNSYGYDLVRRGQGDLPISPDSAPETIARILIAWLGEQQEAEGGAWPGDALLAALHTRQPQEIVHTITQSIERNFETGLAKMTAAPAERREAAIAHQKKFWAQALVAALGHNELTKYVLGRADPNIGTNDFGKTALMYAAQHDRLNAVRLLLAHSVNVDAITDASIGCDRLDRDHRTALMYAAENASAKVIDALIDASANIAAQDTKGNTPLWYFARNTTVTNAAERARLVKRLGG